MIATPSEARRRDAAMWLGLSLVLAPLLVRATSNISLMPGWDIDPLVLGSIRSGLSPVGSLLIDAIVLIGSAILLIGTKARRARVHLPTIILAFVGCVPVLAHAMVFGSAGISLGNARVGSAWVSAVVGGVCVWHAGRCDARVVRVAGGVIGGFLALLALRGAQEWFIEHPRQVAAFTADKARILGSHGWSVGSASAMGFERRLMQREASGWFGLSNVFASFAAAGVVLFIGLLAEANRVLRGAGLLDKRPARWALIAALGGAVVSAGALSFSQSKGGLIACVAGLVALGALMMIRSVVRKGRMTVARARLFGGIVGIGAVLGSLALISLRGAVGERVGELSLLFRWFYAEAAVRALVQHPLWGVGPDGFQQAYAIVKNPLSPEEVTSPHIVVMDYLATLGAWGLAWVLVLGRAAWACGAAGARNEQVAATPQSGRNEARTLLLIPALATLGATYLQGLVVTEELALVRLVGLLAWCALAWGIWRAQESGGVRLGLGLRASALALAAHAQIDVAGVWSQSAGLVAVWIALGAVGDPTGEREAPGSVADTHRVTQPGRGPAPVIAGVLALVVGGLIGVLALQTQVWQSHLDAGAKALEPVTDLRQRVELLREAVESRRVPRESVEVIAGDLGRALGDAPPRDEQSFARAMLDLEARLIPDAVEHLRKADRVDPDDARSRREASRLLTRLAEQRRAANRMDAALDALLDAERVLRVDGQRLLPGDTAVERPGSDEWYALYLVRERRAELSKTPSAYLEAAAALERAIGLDPYNLEHARRRFRLAERLNDAAGTRRWAERTLELHRQMRLDATVKGLNAAELAEVERAAGNPGLADDPRP